MDARRDEEKDRRTLGLTAENAKAPEYSLLFVPPKYNSDPDFASLNANTGCVTCFCATRLENTGGWLNAEMLW